MSARPPFEPLPPEPLDADEMRLAKIHRALPDPGPPAALDARILAQARAAVTPPKRKPRPWFLGAGFGAAAAAVMAAGVAWQLGWLGGVPGADMAPGVSTRDDTRRQAPKEDATGADQEERIDIDFVRQERKAEAAAQAASAPPPAAAKPHAPKRKEMDAPPPPAGRAQPAAPPAPRESPPEIAAEAMPEPLQDAAPAVLSAPAPEPFPAQAPSRDAREAESTLGAAARSNQAPQSTQEGAAKMGLERGQLSKQHAPFPYWTEDERLAPEQWLQRIRERVDAGDRQSAVFSLRRFVLVHPQHAVPRELQRLLVE